MASRRNQHGVNNSIDCYRTFGSERFEAWSSCATQELINAYRAAGVRCRRQGVELFVHIEDLELAASIDQAA